MKNKLEYLIKHNGIVQITYRMVMSFVFRFLGLFCKIDNNQVLLNSYSGKRFDDSPKVLFERMLEREDCKDLHFVWAFNSPEQYDFPRTKCVRMHGMSYWKAALSSKYWISNVNIECGLSFKKNQQIYINTWHGTGAKKVGNAVGGRNDYDFSNVDIISSDGPLLNQIMINDFNAQESSLMMCGRPREDSLYRMNEFDRGRIKRSLGIQDDSHVVLYAPTWRESLDGGTTFRYEPPIHIEKWATLLGENTVVLFRAHSITTDTMDLEGLDHVIDCSNYPELNELMFVSDALISDYSGIFIDFASQRKPIFSFAYDYDEYASSRGMYFDIRDYITTFYSEDEMMNYLKDFDYSFESDKAGLFFDTFAGYGGNAATKCIDKMLELGRSK